MSPETKPEDTCMKKPPATKRTPFSTNRVEELVILFRIISYFRKAMDVLSCSMARKNFNIVPNLAPSIHV